MISVYKPGDEFIWVPVAKENAGNAARAFLPFMGLTGEYLYGYKARIEKGDYYKALSDIQNATINKTFEIFEVKRGPERQNKNKWRHGRQENAPLLGPTKGWVKVPIARITQCIDAELARSIEQEGSPYALLSATEAVIEPVLCDDENELSSQSKLLRQTIRNRIPVGQSKPARTVGMREGFVRDASVVAYVLNQANGNCECCHAPAPFKRDDGEPYLEVHHVRHLAAEGSDKIENAIAACPNCHRELHFGAMKIELIDRLFANIERLVRE